MFVGALTLVFGFALQRFGSGIPSSESQKMPYLGGGAPRAHAWQRYHVRYYSMTLLFIAFEMEMMFMYPWAVVFLQEGMKAMIEMEIGRGSCRARGWPYG